MTNRYATIDANEAVASVAYRINELIAIYPITPASPMGEWADSWASSRLPNIWGTPPVVVQMQSEAGAAGAVHGGLQCGSLATTFTASQGLLLMLPNMYKIAGELTPAVIHVAARTVATHALSIFCDHSDVMAARMTGFALVASSSVQEAQDMALVCQAATLQSRVPVLHFFDGFRTSHEIAKIETLDDEILRAVLDEKAIAAHRARALSPDHPVIRGTAQNPDVFFQAREAGNPFYQAFADHFTEVLADFAQHTGRHYRPFEYYGDQQAERVVVLMGSASETARETVDYLNARGVRLGVVAVRLYRPFDGERFVAALPTSVRAVAVLDRTKEPGATGEPLYLDCVAALHEAVAAGRWEHGQPPRVVGGRYGLSSKEFTPAMVRSVFEQLEHASVRHRFTVGINDDVSHSSLDYDPAWTIESDDVYRAIFHGLGSDGTVSANKNTIKIIGQETDFHVQGYFVYDSKKAGAVTISHLRFGPCPIRSTYLIQQAQLVACHQPSFLDRYDLFEPLVAGGTVLLNHLSPPDELFATLPPRVQQQLLTKRARLFTIDASKVARECGMAGRINVVMQVCFFTVSEVLPREKALQAIRHSIEKTYRSKGEVVVAMNLAAVDATLAQLHEVELPRMPPPQSKAAPSDNGTTTAAPALVRDVLLPILHRCGDQLPVSALPVDGTFPTGTSAWEKRNLAAEIPVWDADICIQCGKCVIVCPHATIRSKVFAPEMLTAAPTTFQSAEARDRAWNGLRYSIQVAPEDCTGCGICVDVCPVRNKSQARCKALNMRPQPPIREQERDNWNFFLSLGEADRRGLQTSSVHQQQIQQPLFEFSGACAGRGETPYLKLLT